MEEDDILSNAITAGPTSVSQLLSSLQFNASGIKRINEEEVEEKGRKFRNSSIDVIVIRQPDGSLLSSPFYIQLGKNSKKHERPVKVSLNGRLVYSKSERSGREHGFRDAKDGTMFRMVVNSGSRWCRFREEDRTTDEQESLERLEPTLGITEMTDDYGMSLREKLTLGEEQRKKSKHVWLSKTVPLKRTRPHGSTIRTTGGRTPKLSIRRPTTPSARENPKRNDFFMPHSESFASFGRTDETSLLKTVSVPTTPMDDTDRIVSPVPISESGMEVNWENREPVVSGRGKKPRSMRSEQFMENMEKEIDVPHDLLVPSSHQLSLMPLRYGPNEMEFEMDDVYTRSYVYLWNSTDRIVVSDIDGTVTKHNARGQILYKMLSADSSSLAQDGIVSLYNRVIQNGYKIVYLSARSIYSMKMTRSFLRAMEQDGMHMPRGPVLISYNSFWRTVFRDTVMKLTGEFKAPTLKTILDLFPQNPFVSAFGDKVSDHVAYRSVGIPSHKIYIADSRSRLYHLAPHPKGDRVIGTYRDLARQCDKIFPDLDRSPPTSPSDSTASFQSESTNNRDREWE